MFCAGIFRDFFMVPWSFRNAMMEPLNATAPISDPSTARVVMTGP